METHSSAGRDIRRYMLHLIVFHQIIFQPLNKIKDLFWCSLPLNEKMLDNLLCIIYQIKTCTWWVIIHLDLLLQYLVHVFINHSSSACKYAHSSQSKAEKYNDIYNMKLHSYYRQTAEAAEAHKQMSLQVSPLGLVQDQWTRAYIQSSTALIDENQNQPDASGLINLPSLAVWD